MVEALYFAFTLWNEWRALLKLIYLNPYNGNFGDVIGVEIFKRIAGRKIKTHDLWKKKRANNERGVFALGSIFHEALDGDIIWGTGINPKWQDKKNSNGMFDIRAVRGPLTRQYILDNLNQPCPEVYGDPGVLAKRVFPEFEWNPIRKYGVIPHFWDIQLLKESQNMIAPTKSWKKVLRFILECEFVIASSLHGIIIAEAFGIPARWWRSPELKSTGTEPVFKYNDYYASTNRSPDDWATTIEEALDMGGKEPITNFDYSSLLEAFPNDA